MRMTRRVKGLAAAAALTVTLLGITVYASFNEPIGSGLMAHSELFNGPATVMMRKLTIFPGELLGWHYHPGAGAYTIVLQGTLTVEDGCGFENVYTVGDAFLEPPNRVHRGKNLGGTDVVTAQTFIVPLGSPTSVSLSEPLCGPPATVNDCKSGGWQQFNHPVTFENQGLCEQWVIRSR